MLSREDVKEIVDEALLLAFGEHEKREAESLRNTNVHATRFRKLPNDDSGSRPRRSRVVSESKRGRRSEG